MVVLAGSGRLGGLQRVRSTLGCVWSASCTSVCVLGAWCRGAAEGLAYGLCSVKRDRSTLGWQQGLRSGSCVGGVRGSVRALCAALSPAASAASSELWPELSRQLSCKSCEGLSGGHGGRCGDPLSYSPCVSCKGEAGTPQKGSASPSMGDSEQPLDFLLCSQCCRRSGAWVTESVVSGLWGPSRNVSSPSSSSIVQVCSGLHRERWGRLLKELVGMGTLGPSGTVSLPSPAPPPRMALWGIRPPPHVLGGFWELLEELGGRAGSVGADGGVVSVRCLRQQRLVQRAVAVCQALQEVKELHEEVGDGEAVGGMET